MLGDLNRSGEIPRQARVRLRELSVFRVNYGKLEPKTSVIPARRKNLGFGVRTPGGVLSRHR